MIIKNFNELEKIKDIEIIYSVSFENSLGCYYTTFEEAVKEAENILDRKVHERKHPYAGVVDKKTFEVWIDKFTWSKKDDMYISHCNTQAEYLWSKICLIKKEGMIKLYSKKLEPIEFEEDSEQK